VNPTALFEQGVDWIMKNRRYVMKSALELILALSIAFSLTATPGASCETGQGVAADAFGKLPLYFIENQGQLNEGVAYYVAGVDRTLYFTEKGVIFALRDLSTAGPAGYPARHVVALDFVGADRSGGPRGEKKQEAIFGFFKGAKENWKTGVPTFGKLVYPELWPGIDLVYSGTTNELKYEFVVEPGADPAAIRLAYRGATGLSVNGKGELRVDTPAGGFDDGAPFAYQMIDGVKKEVAMHYRLDGEGSDGAFTYGFDVGAFDRDEPLVLDPFMIVYCGYLGGSGMDECLSVAVDADCCAYVVGDTESSDVPTAVGPDLSYNGSGDLFVTKLNRHGTGVVYCGYIGGSSVEFDGAIAVDSSGNAYVSGTTHSTDLPVCGGLDPSANGYEDVFVAKINASGLFLDYCGYIGGDMSEGYSDIAVDSSGCAYVRGRTGSSQTTFPVVVGPDLTYNGDRDIFVAKVNAQGSALDYCGYIGGTGQEYSGPGGIAVDSAGCAYVSGTTYSADLPCVVGPDLSFNGGAIDAFVAKVDADGSGLAYCGYIGGGSDESGYGIDVDGNGCAYMTGNTRSTESTFPVTGGPGSTHNGANDAFAAKVNAAGTGLAYCRYVGGSDHDYGLDIAVDPAGNAYLSGTAYSKQNTFPVTVGPDLTFNHGMYDAFVAKIDAQDTTLSYCGYIGGSNWDEGFGIDVDQYGNAYVTGFTMSGSGTFPVAVGPRLNLLGYADGYIAKVSHGDVVADIKANGSDGPLSLAPGTAVNVTLSVTPGSQENENHDWWVVATKDYTNYTSWIFPDNWVPGLRRVYGGPLVALNNHALFTVTIPAGSSGTTWNLFFALDYMNNVAEGSYRDVVVITAL